MEIPTGMNAQGGLSLTSAVKIWPTPSGCGFSNEGQGAKIAEMAETYEEAVAMTDGRKSVVKRYWPTAMSRDHKGGRSSAETQNRNSRPLNEIVEKQEVSGQLSPCFVEWLMGFPRFHTRISHEQKHGEEAGATCDTGSMLPEMRHDEGETIGKTPQGLQQAIACRDTLHAVSSQGGSGDRVATEATTESMQDVRRDVCSEPQQEPLDLLQEVLVSIGREERLEAMEGAFTEEELRLVRQAIQSAKSKGEDVLSFMWEQAGMGSPWVFGEWPGQPRVESGIADRADRIRCLGNAVVPQVAEYIGKCILENQK